MWKLSDRSKERLEGVDPRLIEVVHLALSISKIDFGIPEDGGVRTAERQNMLFKTFRNGKRVSNADGYDKISEHQKKTAVDMYAYVDGKASWDELHLAMVATAFLQAASILGIKLKWGGNFKNFKDMPHFQLG